MWLFRSRFAPDPDAPGDTRADPQGMRPTYAIYWSEGEGPRHVGKLELGRLHALLSGAGRRVALPLDELAEVEYVRGKLLLHRRRGAPITIGNLDAPGALFELAGRLASSAPDASAHPSLRAAASAAR